MAPGLCALEGCGCALPRLRFRGSRRRRDRAGDADLHGLWKGRAKADAHHNRKLSRRHLARPRTLPAPYRTGSLDYSGGAGWSHRTTSARTPRSLGLHNLSAEPWTGQLRNGNVLPVAPGKTVQNRRWAGGRFRPSTRNRISGRSTGWRRHVTEIALSVIGGATGASALGSSHIARGKSPIRGRRRSGSSGVFGPTHSGGRRPWQRTALPQRTRGSRMAVDTLIALFRDVTRDGALRRARRPLPAVVPDLAGALIAQWREKCGGRCRQGADTRASGICASYSLRFDRVWAPR